MSVVELAANGVSLLVFLETAVFVFLYATRSTWRASLVSRALMYVMGSLCLIMAYVFVSRWLDVPEQTRQWVGLAIYLVLAAVLGWMLVALLYAQSGRITAKNPNYTPIRDWIERRRKKAN